MTDYRLFKGSYPKVFTQLGLKFFLEQPYNPDEMNVLDRDLDRTPYFSQQLNASKIKERLSKEFNEIPSNRYLQGDLCTGIYELINSFILCEKIKKKPDYSPPTDSSAILKTCFTDDNNVLCAFSFALTRDETTPDHFNFTLTIYRNITALPKMRSILYITSSLLLNESNPYKGEIIKPTDSILKQVKRTLQCTPLFNAIAPFINDSLDENSYQLFKKLNDCFVCDENAYPLLLIIQATLSHQNKVQHAMNDSMEKTLKLSYWNRTGKYIFQRTIPILLSIALSILIISQIALPIIALITTFLACYVTYTSLKAIRLRLNQEKQLPAYVADRDIKIQQADGDFEKEKLRIASIENNSAPKPTHHQPLFQPEKESDSNDSSESHLTPRH